MLEFKHRFTEEEGIILEALNDRQYATPSSYRFHRRPAISLRRLAESEQKNADNLEKVAISLNKINREEVKQDIRIRRHVAAVATALYAFSKRRSKANDVVRESQGLREDKDILTILKEVDVYTRLTGLVGTLSDKIIKIGPQETELLEFLRKVESPEYAALEKSTGLTSTTIEQIVRGLQGIVSIRAQEKSYDDVFIPAHVFKDRVLPALESSDHTYVQSIDSSDLLEIFGFMHQKTSELKNRFGKRFRTEFTRPEICAAVQTPRPTLKEFRECMKPLEGIVARIERRKQITGKNGYLVYYWNPSWFVPTHYF